MKTMTPLEERATTWARANLHGPFGAIAALALLACSGTSASPSISSGDSGAPPPDGGTIGDNEAGSPGDDAGRPDARPKPDGGSDAAPAEAPIDPLVVGHTWTYDVTEVGSYPLCPSGKHEGAVLSSGTRDGRFAYEVRSLCANVGSLYYAADGDVLYWDYSSTWVLVLDAPVVEGHTWSNGLTSYAWHDVGSVAVAAGTFEKCFKAADTLGPSYSVYCRGVGPVRFSYRDAQGNGYDAVLTAKNF